MPYLGPHKQRKILFHITSRQEAAEIARELRKLGYHFGVDDCHTQVADLVNHLKQKHGNKDEEFILQLCEMVSGISGYIETKDIEGPL